jgi:cytochrome-b5 reductase
VEQVHPWVNYDQILSKCYVGTLKPHAEFDPTEVFKPAEKSPPKALNEETANNATNKEPILLPRFDWIQKLDYITIIFYTGNFSNPMLEVNRADDKTFHIFLTYSGHVFDNEIMFADKVHWPCRIRVGCETGKVELVYRKCQGSVWDNFGVLKQKSKAKAKALVESRLKCKVANKTKVNYNTFLIELERSDGNRSIVPSRKTHQSVRHYQR